MALTKQQKKALIPLFNKIYNTTTDINVLIGLEYIRDIVKLFDY